MQVTLSVPVKTEVTLPHLYSRNNLLGIDNFIPILLDPILFLYVTININLKHQIHLVVYYSVSSCFCFRYLFNTLRCSSILARSLCQTLQVMYRCKTIEIIDIECVLLYIFSVKMFPLRNGGQLGAVFF